MIKGSVLWGSGADTFMMEFPQDDYAVRYSRGQSTGCVYDKPHNMYLQLIINFGIIGMIAFMTMVIMAVVQMFVVYPSNGNHSLKQNDTLIGAVYVGIIAFLIAALSNDSSIHVMPMFYGLLGGAAALRTDNTSHSNISR